MKVCLGLLFVVLVCVCLVVCPLINIWVLNTLFKLGIDYTFYTWLASLLLFGQVGAIASSSKKK